MLAANPGLTIAELMRAARCSSGFAMRAIADQREAQRAAKRRAVDLLRHLLAHGPKHGDHIEAAADAADISEPALLAATDALGVRTKRMARDCGVAYALVRGGSSFGVIKDDGAGDVSVQIHVERGRRARPPETTKWGGNGEIICNQIS